MALRDKALTDVATIKGVVRFLGYQVQFFFAMMVRDAGPCVNLHGMLD